MTRPTTIELDAAASPEANECLTAMLRAAQDALRAPATDEAALEDGIRRALLAYDRFLAHVTASHPMSCAVGCTACCHDNPRGVTGVEVERLVRAVAAWPDGSAVRSRFAELAAIRTDAETWRSARRACPLLEDGRCRAYSLRPLACRAFVAATPAAWCDPAHPSYPERVNPHLDPPKIILQIFQALSARRGLSVAIDLHTGMARS